MRAVCTEWGIVLPVEKGGVKVELELEDNSLCLTVPVQCSAVQCSKRSESNV